jgi:hypothetical protein
MPNVYIPKINVRPVTTRAIRRKSRRFVSDIFVSPVHQVVYSTMPKGAPKDFDRSLICS